MIQASEIQAQQLIKNLFVSAENKNRQFNQKQSMVVSPDFIQILLKDATIWSKDKKLILIKRIASFFKAQPLNTLILGQKDSQINKTLNQIIHFMLRILNQRSQITMFVSIISSFLQYYPLTLNHFKQLTQIIGWDYHMEKLSWARLQMVIQTLKSYYQSRHISKTEPKGFFYFYGQQSGIKVKCNEAKWPFQQTIGFLTCFEIRHSPQNHKSYFFHIQTCLQQTISLYVQNQTIYFQVNNMIINIIPVKSYIWFPLQFQYNFQQGKIQITLQDTSLQKQQISILSIDSSRTIVSFIIGKDFYGRINSPIVFSGNIPKDEGFRTNPFGFQNWDNIIQAKQKKNLTGGLFGYFPFAMTHTHQKLLCFDPIRRCHGQLLSNTSFFSYKFHLKNIGMLGGLRITLPLFYLGQFYPSSNINIIELLIKLVITPFKYKYTDLERDTYSCSFFSVLAYLISQYDSKHFTLEFVELLKQFKSSLRQSKLKQQFFSKVLWSIPIHLLKDSQSINLYYSILIQSYRKNPVFYEGCYSLSSILYYIVLNLEDSSNNCCFQHYANESILTDTPALITIEYSKVLHLKKIKQIIEIIILQNLKNNYKKGLDQIKNILRLFLTKLSACLNITLLQIIKTILKMGKQKNGQSAIIVKQCNMLPFLFHLANKSINPDVIAETINILLYLQTQFPHNIDQDKITYFISSIFKKFSTVLKQPINTFEQKLQISDQEKQTPFIKQLNKVKPQTIASTFLIYSTIKKYYYAKLNQNGSSPPIVNEQAIRLVISYYEIASKQIKQVILVDFLSQITFSQHNLSFLSSSLYFSNFICSIIHTQSESKSITFELAIKIGVKIFHQKVKSKKIKQFYIILRAVVQFNKTGGEILYVLIIQFLKRLSKKQVQITQALTQIGFIIFCQLKRSIRKNNPQQIQPFFRMVDRYIALVYEQCCQHFGFIEQDDFQSKFYPNILQQSNTSSLLLLFTTQFSDQISKQQQMYLLFDNLLSKCQFESKIQIQDMFKKRLYIIEIFCQLLQISIQRNLHEDNFNSEYYLNILVKTVVLFCSILTNQTKKNISLDKNVLGRKILFQTLNFLFLHSQQPLQKDMISKSRDTLLIFVFEYIDYLDRMLGRHTSMNSLIKRIQQLKLIRYNPFLIQLFEFFLRNQFGKPLISLSTINQLVKTNHINIQSIIPDFQWVFTRQILKSLNQALQKKDQHLIKKMIQSGITDKKQQIAFMASQNDYSSEITEGILANFDYQSPKQQKMRLLYIDMLEKNLRKVASRWKKIWQLLRIYHMPYGIWMNQRQTMQNKDFKNSPFKNFKSKMSKYLSKSGCRPILTVQMIQPTKILKQQKLPVEQQMKNLVSLPSRLIKPSMNKKVPKSNYQLQFKVIWIRDSNHIKGTLIIYQQYLIFTYESVKQKDIHTSFAPFKLHIWQQLIKKWYYVDIINMVRKRYLLEHIAIEFIFSNYTSIFIAFQNPKVLEKFIQQINKIRKQMNSKWKQIVVLNKVPFCTKQFLIDSPDLNLLKIKSTQDWVERKISTFNYLMRLNFLSSRSYNDYSQYPVFPWIVQGSNTKSPILRNLEKNMGSLGTPQRVQAYKSKYKSVDPFSESIPYFFGTHYSSPGVVFNYLIRIQPFTECTRQLQGGKFDLPDRMFFSLQSTWNSAIKQMSDVRQLIPEYYYLPEMLLNLDNYRLGTMQNGQRVDDVELPIWAANAYHFATQFRQILQSEQVSQKINNWIDLIFGYKQKGKQGQNAMNIFYYLTYENSVNLKQITDQIHRSSCQAQIIHFGQTPSQLFHKPHPQRNLIQKKPLQLKVLTTVKLPVKQFKQKVYSFYIDQHCVKILYKQVLISYSKIKDNCNNRQVLDIDYLRHKSKHLRYVDGIGILNIDQAVISFFQNGRFILIAGYLDNTFRVYSTQTMQLVAVGTVHGIVSKVLVTQEGDLIIVGTESGTLQVIQIKYESTSTLKLTTIFIQYLEQKISHISENQAFLSVSFGDMVSIYRVTRSLQYLIFQQRSEQQIKFFRSFKNKIKINGTAIVQSPLFSIIIFDNLGLKTYSINGQLIATLPTSQTIQQVSLIKDAYNQDIIVVFDDDKLLCISTPDLRKISYQEMNKQDLWQRLFVLKNDTIKILGGNQ